MHILNPIAEFPPEVAKAVLWPAGGEPPDGVRLLAELATFCGGAVDVNAELAAEWADNVADAVRPYVLRGSTPGESLEAVWRYTPDAPAGWGVPPKLSGVLMHSIASRLGIETRLVQPRPEDPVPGLLVEDYDTDRILTPLDGCLEAVEKDGAMVLRPRLVLTVALVHFLDASSSTGRSNVLSKNELSRRAMNAARLTAALSPTVVSSWIDLAEASLRCGEAGYAYTLGERLVDSPGGHGAWAVYRAAASEIARRN